MWEAIITFGLTLLGMVFKWWGNKEKMSKLMYEWLKAHRMENHIKSFLSSDRQNGELDGKPFEPTP